SSLNRKVASKCCSKVLSRSARGTMASSGPPVALLLLTSMGLEDSAWAMRSVLTPPAASSIIIIPVIGSRSFFIINLVFSFYFHFLFPLLRFTNLQRSCFPVDLSIQDLAQRPGQDVQVVASDRAGYPFLFIGGADDHLHAKGTLDAPGDVVHWGAGKGKYIFRP